MDRARIAENLLRVVVSRDRARAMVGDVIEEHGTTRGTRFWIAFAKLFVAFAWRPVLAFTIAFLVGILFPFYLSVVAARHLFFGQMQPWASLFPAEQYGNFCGPLGTLAAFTLVKFGMRGRLWVVSAVCIVPAVLKVYSFWTPRLEQMAWVAGIAVIIFCFIDGRNRRSFAIVTVIVLLHWCLGRADGFAFAYLVRHAIFSSTLRMLLGALELIATPVIEMAVCSSLYRRFMTTNLLAS